MMAVLRKKELLTVLLLLNLISIVVYFFIAQRLGYFFRVIPGTLPSEDAWQYRQMGNWLLGTGQADCSPTRPFLYPLFISLTSLAGGTFLTWLAQFVLLLSAVNLSFASAWLICRNKFLALLPALLLATNFSVIALTYMELTETLTIFFCALLVFFMIRDREKQGEFSYMLRVLLLLALLSVTRPVFFPAFLATAALSLLVYRKAFVRLRNLMLFSAACLPVLIQSGIMKYHFNTFSLSKISGITFRQYYFSEFYREKKNISFDEARQQADTMSAERMRQEILDDVPKASGIFYRLLGYSIGNVSNFVLPEKDETLGLLHWRINRFCFRLHHWMGLPVLLALLMLSRRKNNDLLPFFILAMLTYLVLLACGLSFMQGDRLAVTALPLWSVLYLQAGVLTLNFFRKQGTLTK
jgi:4-amino-4-deoxy-L-arabinose transferase-like glycosyltransferase